MILIHDHRHTEACIRIAAVPSFPVLRQFPEGCGFKQWTGDDSKVLMKVSNVELVGSLHAQLRSVCDLMPNSRPPFPYPQAYCAIIGLHHITLGWVTLGQVTLGQVTSPHVGSHHITLGRVALHCIASHRVGPHHIALGCIILCQVVLHRVALRQSRYYRVTSCCYQPYSVCYPSLLLFPFLHTLFLLFLRRFSLYLHTSLFSFCHCDPGRLPLTLTLPYPCHLLLRYF